MDADWPVACTAIQISPNSEPKGTSAVVTSTGLGPQVAIYKADPSVLRVRDRRQGQLRGRAPSLDRARAVAFGPPA